ncbi:MAG TPA: pseudouridine synthase [Bacillota bacterium]|nr:pseudouridine synthase [Bacillota bacterium]
MRLQKYMSLCGIGSRRKSEEFIKQSRVSVNGRIVTKMGVKVDPHKDEVYFDGRVIELDNKKYYILLNKPKGIVTSVKDQFNRKTVIDVIDWEGPRIYPVGRLDYNTEGLIILTNDGELTNKLTHPKYGVEKEYFCIARGRIQTSDIHKLRNGVDIGNYKTSPAKVVFVRYNKENSELCITISEGKNRQVRRMFDAIGYPILYLRRERMGDLKINDLVPGGWRFLYDKEIKALKEL